ncbi:flagellar basal body rod protein FlgC [Methyloversatilis sp.]|uniref:flagellar basal body rod protein FlgC n=1 Tax=Methyloversatilis sp. TaxID=2569862 RepID=UPI0035B49664
MFNVFGIAGSALTAQSVRLNTTSSNLANADSVVSANGQPYRARQVVFEMKPIAEGEDASGVRVTRIVESAAPLRTTYDPTNPAANGEGYVQMPNVNVVEEMVNMISASRSYQTNAEMMNTAKQLMLKTLSIGQ